VTAFLAAGCGSEAAGSGEPAEAASGQVSEELVSTFEQQLEPLGWEAPGPALDAGDALDGETMYLIVDVANLPFTQRLIQSTEAAAAVVGMEVIVVQHQFNPSEASRLIEQAVNSDAAVVAVEGFSGAQLQAPLKAASDAGVITMTTITTPEPGPLTEENKAAGLFAHVSYCSRCIGEQMALATTVLSDGAANVGLVYTGDYPSAKAVRDGFREELERICSGCSYTEKSVPTASYTTAVGPATTSLISNPDINYLIPVFDILETYMEPAIAASGAEDRLSIVTNDADPPQMKLLQDGRLVVGEVGLEVEKIGWSLVDNALRASLDLPAVDDPLVGLRTFTSDNIDELDLDADPITFYGVDDYEPLYSKLWGLG
jgi:ribose transport system substrate-binding protein